MPWTSPRRRRERSSPTSSSGSSSGISPRSCASPTGWQATERWPLGGDEAPFAPVALIAGPRGPLVLSESADYEQGRLRLDALDLTDGSRSTAFETTFEPGSDEVHLAQGRPVLEFHARADLPAGWFLIARFGAIDAGVLPPPDYSAATVGAAPETKLPFMESPTR